MGLKSLPEGILKDLKGQHRRQKTNPGSPEKSKIASKQRVLNSQGLLAILKESLRILRKSLRGKIKTTKKSLRTLKES